MGLIRGSLLLVPIVLALAIFNTAQEVRPPSPSNSRGSPPPDQPLYYPASCTTDQPLYASRSGKPIWLDTDSLLRSAAHCEAPIMPSLARQMRIRGYFSVNMLVDDKGKIFCVKSFSGHPMLAGSALDAAKKWTFLPKTQYGKEVWFYGHLRFQFLAGKTTKNSCTIAR
jgi:TonB family protein